MKFNVKEALQAIRTLLAEEKPEETPVVEVKADETSENDGKSETEATPVEVQAADVPPAPAEQPAEPELEKPDQKYAEMEQRLGGLEQKLNEIIQRMNGMQGVMMSDLAPIKKAVSELATVIEQFAELPTEEPTQEVTGFRLPKKTDRLAEIADNVKAAKEMIKK